MLASTQTLSLETRPTAPVLVSAAVCETRYVPGCSESTCVTMPAKGARTDGVVELALRLVDLRLGLQILRVLGRRNVGIAAEPGELHLRLLLQRGELARVGFERVARSGRSWPWKRNRSRTSVAYAIVVSLIEFGLRLLRSDVAQHALVVLLHRFDRQRRLRQIGLDVVERDLELLRIDRKSTSPALTVWPSWTSTELTRPETSVDTMSLAA